VGTCSSLTPTPQNVKNANNLFQAALAAHLLPQMWVRQQQSLPPAMTVVMVDTTTQQERTALSVMPLLKTVPTVNHSSCQEQTQMFLSVSIAPAPISSITPRNKLASYVLCSRTASNAPSTHKVFPFALNVHQDITSTAQPSNVCNAVEKFLDAKRVQKSLDPATSIVRVVSTQHIWILSARPANPVLHSNLNASNALTLTKYCSVLTVVTVNFTT